MQNWYHGSVATQFRRRRIKSGNLPRIEGLHKRSLVAWKLVEGWAPLMTVPALVSLARPTFGTRAVIYRQRRGEVIQKPVYLTPRERTPRAVRAVVAQLTGDWAGRGLNFQLKCFARWGSLAGAGALLSQTVQLDFLKVVAARNVLRAVRRVDHLSTWVWGGRRSI